MIIIQQRKLTLQLDFLTLEMITLASMLLLLLLHVEDYCGHLFEMELYKLRAPAFVESAIVQLTL